MKTRKLITTAAALMSAAMACVPFGASAYTDKEDDGTYKDFRYRIVGEYAAITDYTGESEIVNIPSSIDGHSVNSIWYHAFSDKDYIKSVILPSSIENIGVSAFSGCTSLTDINIPLWINEISSCAFSGCTSLESISIPRSCAHVRDHAFHNCTSLSDITVDPYTDVDISALEGTAWYEAQPDGLVYLNTTAYCWKGDMPENTDIVFKDGTEAVGSYIFWKNPNVRSCYLPESVTRIGWMSFCLCPNLKSVTIVNSRCQMEYFRHTISNYEYSVPLGGNYHLVNSAYTGIIVGAEKSYAQQYAKQFKYTFRTFDDKNILGDVNDDGEFNVADLVSLTNRVLKNESVGYWQMGDLNGDGKLNAFDMVDMREAISSSSSTEVTE